MSLVTTQFTSRTLKTHYLPSNALPQSGFKGKLPERTDRNPHHQPQTMKRSSCIVLAVAITLIAPLSALAGPIQTKFIQGTALNVDFVLNVPAGKAITVLNFFHSNSDVNCDLWLQVGSTSAFSALHVMKADHPFFPVDNKDLTVDGPAKVFVNMPESDRCVLSYKLFPN